MRLLTRGKYQKRLGLSFARQDSRSSISSDICVFTSETRINVEIRKRETEICIADALTFRISSLLARRKEQVVPSLPLANQNVPIISLEETRIVRLILFSAPNCFQVHTSKEYSRRSLYFARKKRFSRRRICARACGINPHLYS